MSYTVNETVDASSPYYNSHLFYLATLILPGLPRTLYILFSSF